MNKKLREQVFNKYNGHCAYCGIKLNKDNFQVDHLIPKKFFKYNTKSGQDDITNLMPACSVCNHYKRALDLETFRNVWLGKLHTRLHRYPKNPRTENGKKRKEYIQRICERYNITENKPFCKKFYFETGGKK